MDEYATPIDQIRPDLNNQQPQQQAPQQAPQGNYSDMLQSMETQQQVQQYQQPNEFPPHPVVQSKMNPNSHMNFGQQPSQHREDEQQTPQIQKDIMYILIPSILLYSSPVQAHILKILPSLFKEERPTILGNIVNGLVISIVFVGLKNMKIKFS